MILVGAPWLTSAMAVCGAWRPRDIFDAALATDVFLKEHEAYLHYTKTEQELQAVDQDQSLAQS